MSDEVNKPHRPLDHDAISSLVAILRESSLTELELRNGTTVLRLRRSPGRLASMSATAPDVVGAVTAAPTVNADEGATRVARTESVPSALVGIFRALARPIQVGDRIDENQVLGHIESMRLMNDCVAPRGGQIVSVLVEDGQPVEYGQPLFEITEEAE